MITRMSLMPSPAADAAYYADAYFTIFHLPLLLTLYATFRFRVHARCVMRSA